jgi:putative FmdB family regulatory protein
MPIYEYECENCGRIEEVLQKFSDKPLSCCGHCSGKLHKLVSQSAFHLKGGGWYVTDYAKKSTGGEEKAAPASSGGEEKAAPTSAAASADKAAKSVSDKSSAKSD